MIDITDCQGFAVVGRGYIIALPGNLIPEDIVDPQQLVGELVNSGDNIYKIRGVEFNSGLHGWKRSNGVGIQIWRVEQSDSLQLLESQLREAKSNLLDFEKEARRFADKVQVVQNQISMLNESIEWLKKGGPDTTS